MVARWAPPLVTSVVVAAAVFLVIAPLGSMVEVRSFLTPEYITGMRQWREAGDPLSVVLFPEGIFNGWRFTSWSLFLATGTACGVSMACAHAVQAGLLGIAAGLGFAHARQITGSLVVAAGVTALWVVSAPVMEAALWGATQHDKLAMCLSLAAAVAWWSQAGRSEVGRTRAVVVTVGLALLVGLAMNAKESSFHLVIALPAIAIVRGLALGKVRRNLAWIALPVAYGAWYVGHYLLHMDPAWATHTSGGDPLVSLPSQVPSALSLGLMLGYGRWDTWSLSTAPVAAVGYLIWAVAVTFLLTLAVWRHRHRLRATATAHPSAMYAVLLAGSLVAIGARASRPHAYYLLLSVWAVLVVAFLSMRAASTGRAPLMAASVAALAAPMLLAFTTHFSASGAVTQLRAASANLEDTFRELRASLPAVTSIHLAIEGRPYAPYYLISGSGSRPVDPWLARWMFADPGNRTRMAPTAPDATPPPGGALVVLTDRYLLRRVTLP